MPIVLLSVDLSESPYQREEKKGSSVSLAEGCMPETSELYRLELCEKEIRRMPLRFVGEQSYKVFKIVDDSL